MAVLRVLKGMNPGQVLSLEGDRAVLGRHPACDIVLEVGAVSRQHAQVLKVGDEYFVEDLHSRNGTFLNDNVIEGRRRLADSDQLKICDLVFVFHSGSPETAMASASDVDTLSTAMMVDDERTKAGSTIMSKVDISSGPSGLRLTVNPEVKLKALLEIGQAVGRAVRLDEVLPKLLDSLFTIFIQADRGFIVLKDPQSDRLIPKATKHRREEDAEQIRISRTIVNEVIASKGAILSADAATDSRFDMSESIVDFHIHSMMCAPLINRDGQVLGVIQVDTRNPRHRFGRDDLEVLASVACQAAVAVENAQLHEEAIAREGLQRELAVAHKVQQGFLPAAPPTLDGYEFFDFYEPASQLGGDYFDYITLRDGRLAVVLADVSGKGVAAALLMVKLSAEIRYCLVSEPTLSGAIGALNNVFCEPRWEDRFITLAMTVIDPERHEVTLINAGHMPPLLRHLSGEIEEAAASTGGLPLGVADDFEYSEATLTLAPGDSLTLYTDGIPDAMNEDNQFYGTERLEAKLREPIDSMHALGRLILDDVRRFVGTQSQTDDMCVACFGRVDA